MYYHASPIKGIKVLEPRVSNHGIPLIYFSKKRENVLVYLSNAVEKYCRETGFQHTGKWQKWASYGFRKDRIQCIDEYYPDALRDTYQGVSGYIYSVETILDSDFQASIPDAATTGVPVPVAHCEFIPDAYEAILAAEREGRIAICRYEELTPARREWNRRTIREEYKNAADQPDYRHFIEGKFHIDPEEFGDSLSHS